MSVVRTRTGCFTCRRRKKKCDEAKPICRGCERNRLQCHWPVDLATPAYASDPARPRNRPTAYADLQAFLSAAMDVAGALPPVRRESGTAQDSRREPTPASLPSCNDGSSGADTPPIAVDSGGDPSRFDETPDSHTLDAMMAVSASSSPTTTAQSTHGPRAAPSAAPSAMALLPGLECETFELLSFYLSRTANSMGNGSTDINPFVAMLVPIAFSSSLVLRLILAQSAIHRHVSEESHVSNEVAQRFYHDSLRQFRGVVGKYVAGRDDNTLTLTVGSLILSLTEVAKGDTYGFTFDHLLGAKSLLSKLVLNQNLAIADDLRDFLVEYYTHMASLSMIAIDPQYTTHSLMDSGIGLMANELVRRKYSGQLCGCWLEILVLLPKTFELGQRMRATRDGSPPLPSPDDITQFGFLQAQITSFTPDAPACSDSALAGLVFKNAALLYLWTILANPHQHSSGSFKTLIDGAVAEALAALSQLPVTSRVNTSLCWPIAVIGNCVSSSVHRQALRIRLESMHRSIGLGNMKETLVLLERAWEQPLEDTSPWTLCKCMQEHQIWISFA